MKLIQQQLLVLALFAIPFIADAQQLYRPAVRSKSSPPLLRETPERVSHYFEIRGGPRASYLMGEVRPGLAGSSLLDFEDDLGLDWGIGLQMDFEMRVAKKWTASINYSTTSFDGPNQVTTRPLTYHNTSNARVNGNTQSNPAILPPGSTISADMVFHEITPQLAFEAYQDKRWTISPTLGFKIIVFSEEFNIVNSGSGANTIDRTEFVELTPLVGVDIRHHLDRHLYLGLSPQAFGTDKYAYITGKAYVGYDFDKEDWGSLGVRLGLDASQFWSDHTGRGSSRYDVNATMLSPFIQMAYGF